jgi:glycolate oxidase FAD binding subunit
MIVENEAQAIEAVRAAASPFEIVAGGTRRIAGTRHAGILDVSRLGGIVNHEPEELILTVKPGASLVEIDSVLAAKGQRLGFEPQDWSAMLGTTGTATIGGAISCNANGPARVRYGAARDHLLGIRAVNGLGEAFKAGGRVVKNVTGFDIPKLVCGAYGTLCVLTELTFRVFPKPPCTIVLARHDVDPREGFALLRKVWSSPLDATALVYSRGTAYVRLEGEKEPLAEKRAALNDLIEVDGIELGFEPGALDIRRVHLRPTEAAAVAADIAAPHWYGDWAGALLWTAGGKPAGQPLHGPGTRSRLDRAVKAAFDPRSLFSPGPA